MHSEAEGRESIVEEDMSSGVQGEGVTTQLAVVSSLVCHDVVDRRLSPPWEGNSQQGPLKDRAGQTRTNCQGVSRWVGSSTI